jgi:branched-chain amino acid aminotransferase
MITTIWINGEFKPKNQPLIMHDDSAFLRGAGVFDSMLAVNGVLVEPEGHYNRLIHDAEVILGITPDFSFTQFCDIAAQILKENGIDKDHYARVRTQITGGILPEFLGKAVNPTITVSCSRTRTPDNQETIKALIVSAYPRIANCIIENCKKLDYTKQYMAMQEARAKGCNEPILTNTDGNIACASTSSLFIVEGKNIITPRIEDGILDSLSRRRLIADYSARQEAISPERFLAADAIFLTNTIRGVRAVVEVNGVEKKEATLDLVRDLNNQIFKAA